MTIALRKAFDLVADNVADSRAQLDELERRLGELPQCTNDDMNLKEWVSGGLYCRQITIPKGGMLVGRVYKFDHMEIMVSGDITIKAANGGNKRYQGHNVIEAKAGKRQAGYAHEETIWMTVNRVPDIPLEQMLDYTSCLTFDHYEAFHAALNRYDFQAFLNELGATQEQMDQMVNTGDVKESETCRDLYLSASKIAGKGLFSGISYKRGDIIAPTRDGSHRTIAGRYTNHALHPNTEPAEDGLMFKLRAVRDIPAGEEITLNYRQVMRFREKRGELCLAQ